MFVSSTSNFHLSFPPKPKPLQPIFTFAQSQSCMNLRTEIGDQKEFGVRKDIWTEKSHGFFEALALAKPQLAYKSPLQRLGEALPSPQLDATSTLPMLDKDLRNGVVERDFAITPSTPHPSHQLQSGGESPSREFPNYSYKLIPSGNGTPTRSNLTRNWDGCSGRRFDDAKGHSTVTSFASTAHRRSPQKNSYFVSTSLLSSFLSSNPRTRAPFKPQKSNRGTSSWQLKQYAEATLGSGSLRKAVKLPEGEDKDEWLAVNGTT